MLDKMIIYLKFNDNFKSYITFRGIKGNMSLAYYKFYLVTTHIISL
jgi:hypothetical protein